MSGPVALNAANLGKLPKDFATPKYDRSAVESGIAHFGVGNFHRAHQAVYADAVLAAGHSQWGVCGLGLLSFDEKMRDTMKEQDCLYTLSVCAAGKPPARQVIGAHTQFLHAPDDANAVLDMLCRVKVVTLTVTEKGYCLDLHTHKLDRSLPNVQADIEVLRSWSPATPLPKPLQTSAGFITAACLKRKHDALPGMAVLSCDNVQSNGDGARESVTAMAGEINADLLAWIAAHVTFPNSMVDRITPSTTPAVVDAVAASGVHDKWPVQCEDFIQWVVEDKFPQGRPPWDQVLGNSCLFVEDVLPYELMKLRLLNGSHQALAYPACLLGHRVVHESMLDKENDVAGFVRAYMAAVSPAVPDVPGVAKPAYIDKLVERFANPAVKDQVLRLVEDGCNRIKVAVVPCLDQALAPGAEARLRVIAFVLASFLKYTAVDKDDKGGAFDHPPDATAPRVKPWAAKAFGDDASADDERNAVGKALHEGLECGGDCVVEAVVEQVRAIKAKGTLHAMRALL